VRAQNVQAADRQVGRLNRRRQQTDKPCRNRLDRGAIEQVGGVFTTPAIPAGVPSAARRSPRLRERSNLVAAVSTGSNVALSPGSSRLLAASFWNASMTWNRGCRANERVGLSASTSRSNGRSWWL
jgi:hypothetical protein